MRKLLLPTVIEHKGRRYVLAVTTRGGLVLQAEDEKSALISVKTGIVAMNRVSLRRRGRASVAQPEDLRNGHRDARAVVVSGAESPEREPGMDDTKGMQEVVKLSEPERAPEHCGKAMRKLSNVSPFGKLTVLYVCDKCGTQTRMPPKDLTGKPKEEPAKT